MYYVLVFLAGVLVGGAVMFFVYRNNEKKFSAAADQAKEELAIAQQKIQELTAKK